MMKLSRRFWSLHVPQLSFFLLSTKDLGGRGTPTTCSMQVHQLQVQQVKFQHKKGKSYNLFNASPTTTIAYHTTANLYMRHNYHFSCFAIIIFLLLTKDLGGRGRSEEKGFHAVSSKQKSTKNLFLVGSFLMCWLAGHFCWNLLLSTKDLDDETQ